MTVEIVVIALALVIALSIGGAGFAHRRQETAKMREHRTAVLKKQCAQIQETLDGLMLSCASKSLRLRLAKWMIKALKEMKHFNPQDQNITLALDNIKSLKSEIDQEPQDAQFKPAKDATEMHMMQRGVKLGIKIAQKMNKEGNASEQEVGQWEIALMKKLIDIEVNSFSYQAELAHAREPEKALKLYRTALNRIVQSEFHGKDKDRISKEIREKVHAIEGKPEADSQDDSSSAVG
jgi:hypothetical protein